MSELFPESIPFGWSLNKVGRIVKFYTGATPPTGDADSYEGNKKWANISDVGTHFIKDAQKTISEEAARKSNIIESPINSLLFSFKLSLGKASIVKEPMYTNEAIATFLENDSININWAYYAFPVFISENAKINIYGSPLLNADLIRSAKILIPDLPTQQRIADFLDSETGKVDNLVDELTKFKTQLQTQRKSLISECVTKGVPEDRKRAYKDSGVEWIGEIPVGWGYGEKLGLLINIISGFPFPSDSFNIEEKGYPLVRIRDIVRGYTETYADVAWEEKAAVTNGDILVGMDGDFNVAIWESQPALLNQRACKVEGKNSGRIFNKFLYYALPTHLKVINDLTYATTVKHLSGSDIKAIKMPVPPTDEQQRIADYLDTECAKINSLISEIDNQIGLLKTYRKSLINEVVTGKVEV